MRVRVDQRGFVVIARAVNVFALLRTGTSVTAYQKFAMLFWFEGVLRYKGVKLTVTSDII